MDVSDTGAMGGVLYAYQYDDVKSGDTVYVGIDIFPIINTARTDSGFNIGWDGSQYFQFNTLSSDDLEDMGRQDLGTSVTLQLHYEQMDINLKNSDGYYGGHYWDYLEIGKQLTEFTLAPKTFTYDGSPHGPTITPTVSGATWAVADGTASATAAGAYSVSVVANGNYAGTGSTNWVINKANALTPVISPSSQTIAAGGSITFTASGGSSGTYNWSGYTGASGGGASKTIAFSAPGTFTISVQDPGDANYNASGLATATVKVVQVLTGVEFTPTTYNGLAQAPLVASVSPNGATYDLSYSATNAGTYSVTITGNGTYAGSTATNNWTINKADAVTPVISPGDQSIIIETPVAFSASGGTTGNYNWSGSAGTTGGGALKPIKFLSLGTFTVSVQDPGDGNHNPSGWATATVTVTPIPVTFTFANLSYTYDGSVKTATVLASPSSATYTAALEAGPDAKSYTVSATANGLFAGIGSATLVIAPATPVVSITPSSTTVSVGGSVTFTASGGVKDYGWGGTLQGMSADFSAVQTFTFPALGTYVITATSLRSDNYNWSNTASATVTVVQAPTTFAFSSLTQVYDGTIKNAIATPNPSGATFSASLSSSSPNVGDYPVSAVANGNFSGSGSATLTIIPATPGVDSTGVSVSPAVSSINAGESVTFTASGGQNGYVWGESAVGSGSTKTLTFPAIGTYTVTVYSPSGGNYNQSNTATATIVVNTIPTTFVFTKTLAVYDGTIQTAGVTPTPSNATYVASLLGGPNVGSYAISAVATGAYTGSGNGTLTISPAQPIVTISPTEASISVGASVAFTASGGQNAYVWGGNASGSGSTQSVAFTEPGVFTVTVYSTPGGNYDTSVMATAVVTVTYPVPTVSLAVDPSANAIKWSAESVASATVSLTKVIDLGKTTEREEAVTSISSGDAAYAGKPFVGSTLNILPPTGIYRARLVYVPVGGGAPVTNISTITLGAPL